MDVVLLSGHWHIDCSAEGASCAEVSSKKGVLVECSLVRGRLCPFGHYWHSSWGIAKPIAQQQLKQPNSPCRGKEICFRALSESWIAVFPVFGCATHSRLCRAFSAPHAIFLYCDDDPSRMVFASTANVILSYTVTGSMPGNGGRASTGALADLQFHPWSLFGRRFANDCVLGLK